MITTTVLIDAGPLVALLSSRDQYHSRCVHQAKELLHAPATCWPVVTEAAYLLKRSPGGVEALLSRITSGALRILSLSAADSPAIAGILSKHRDQGFDFADACLMHLAERERIDCIFTIDRRHFDVFRQTVGRPMTLIPPL